MGACVANEHATHCGRAFRNEARKWRKCLALPVAFLLTTPRPSVSLALTELRPLRGRWTQARPGGILSVAGTLCSKKRRRGKLVLLRAQKFEEHYPYLTPDKILTWDDESMSEEEHEIFYPEIGKNRLAGNAEWQNRRCFVASTLLAVGASLHPNGVDASSTIILATDQSSALQWEASPINKRYGVTLYDAEKSGYNVRFITYLSRFLLSFDEDCQRWWFARAGDIPRTANKEQVDAFRLKQFAAFSASVEVGLQVSRNCVAYVFVVFLLSRKKSFLCYLFNTIPT